MRFLWSSFLSRLSPTSAAKSLGVLVGGSAIAQALPLIALPVVTRLYSPADFSTFAVYTSAVTVIAVAACLRLELAIPLPERDAEAVNLLWISICSALVVSCVLAILLLSFRTNVARLLGDPQLEPYLLLIPIGVFSTAALSAAQFWSTRKERFRSLANTRVLQSGSGVTAQLAAGSAGVGAFGLLASQIISSLLAFILLILPVIRSQGRFGIDLRGAKNAFIQHNRFAKFSILEAFANTAGIQVPIILIAAVAAGPEAGFFALASRIIGTPTMIISIAAAQLYASRAPIEARNGSLANYTASLVEQLAKYGLIPMVALCIFAPALFEILFGEKWVRAGELVKWLAPWFFLQYLTIPISMVIHIVGRQDIALLLQLGGMCFRILCVGMAAFWMPQLMVEIYAASGVLFYTIYFLVAIHYAGLKRKDGIKAVLASKTNVFTAGLFAIIAIASAVLWKI